METLAFAAQMRELDRVAIEELGIPSLTLMEHAAQAVTEEVLAQLATPAAPRVALFCGPGNNGGDGAAAARLLRERGVEVRAFLVGDRAKMTPDEAAMEKKLLAAGGSLEPFDPQNGEQAGWLENCQVVVDAIFGVGLSRPVSGVFRTAVERINTLGESGCRIVACDIPSGVSADTGEILGAAVRAHTTITFTCGKPGLWLGEGGPCGGRVRIVPIGVPEKLVEQLVVRQPSPVRVLDEGRYPLPRRSPTAHKGMFGKVFLLAGSEGYTGAPVLAARAAVHSGAGLVYLGVPRDIYPIAAVKCDEAMPFPLPEDDNAILEKASSCDVALIGPGLGRKPETEALVRALLEKLEIPVVLDADGINALSGHIDSLNQRKALTVLTPHDGEFARLTGCQLPILDRLNGARDFAQAHGCVMILKGHHTITASPTGEVYLNTTGNPGMAKGGSGDVLAGLLASLLGQKQLAGDPALLCARGVYYHGQAGDRCAQRLGEYGMTPTDLLEQLPLVLKEHTD